MSTSHGHGFGKTILFGEHFVVHGLPALVAALPLVTTASLRIIPVRGEEKPLGLHLEPHSFKILEEQDYHLIDQRPKIPNFQATKTDKYYNLMRNIAQFMGVSAGLEVILAGNLLVTSGGIGASAAAAVSIARAVNQAFGLGWSDEKINQAALQGEKAVHGNPSGIDNTAALYGGTFMFHKQGELYQKRTAVTLRQPLNLVLIDSGQVSDTKSVIAHVNELKEKKPHVIDEVFSAYQNLFDQAYQALKIGDLQTVGLLMSMNHEFLKKLGVSNSKLDELVSIACQAGAWGAKLTGTGKGGLVVALTPSKHVQAHVAEIFQQLGYITIVVTIQR